VLLQVLDDGRLTDGQGRVVDFSNVVIIMTSNLGSQYLLSGITDGEISPRVREQVMLEVKKHFKPEFLNRLDDIVIFKPLGRTELHKIIRIQILHLEKRLEDKDIKLDVHESALDLILKVAYDPVYGARPLKRYLEKHIVTQLSKMILTGEAREHCIVHVEATKGDQLSFVVEETEGTPKKKPKTN
jgi:ATP-dependent Clp protease ATP-binding subunit ClpB